MSTWLKLAAFISFVLLLLTLLPRLFSEYIHSRKGQGMIKDVLKEPVELYQKQKLLGLLLNLSSENPERLLHLQPALSSEIFLYTYQRGRILNFREGFVARQDLQRLVQGTHLGERVFAERSEAVFGGGFELDYYLKSRSVPEIFYPGYQRSGPFAWQVFPGESTATLFMVRLNQIRVSDLIAAVKELIAQAMHADSGQSLWTDILLSIASALVVALVCLFGYETVSRLKLSLVYPLLMISIGNILITTILLLGFYSLDRRLQIFQSQKLLEARALAESSRIDQELSHILKEATPKILSRAAALNSDFNNIPLLYFTWDTNGHHKSNAKAIHLLIFVKTAKSIVTALSDTSPELVSSMVQRLDLSLHDSLQFGVEKTANIAFGLERMLLSGNAKRLIPLEMGSQDLYFAFAQAGDGAFVSTFLERKALYSWALKQISLGDHSTVTYQDEELRGTTPSPNDTIRFPSTLDHGLQYAFVVTPVVPDRLQWVLLILSGMLCLTLIYVQRSRQRLNLVWDRTQALLLEQSQTQIKVSGQDEFYRVLSTIDHCEQELEQKRKLTPFVAKRLMAFLLDENHELQTQIQSEGTVLFADLRSFTTISETMEPEDIVSLLNQYFDLWQESVDRFGGVTERFIGDAIVVLFSKRLDASHAMHAIECGLRLLVRLQEFNSLRQNRQELQIQCGIGIASGEILTRILGDDHKRHLVSSGMPVSRAEALEALTKSKGVSLLIDSSTKTLVEHSYTLCNLAEDAYSVVTNS